MPSDILLQDGTHPPQIAIDQNILPSDEKRAQELDQYFRPLSPAHLYPDPVLTAHMQLIAWRLDIQRAMVSFIDRDTQFFVAESTKTMDLRDSSMFDGKNNDLWAGGTGVPMAGRLCEITIVAQETTDGTPAHFESCDLTVDQRFCDLACVTGCRQIRYYCGIPLRSKTGTAIGSVFVLDSRTREPMSALHLNFLLDVAKNVMTHIETGKEKMDVKRIMKMNKSLAEFVDPTRYHWASTTSDFGSSCQRIEANDERLSPSRSSNNDEEGDRPCHLDSSTSEEVNEHDQEAIEAEKMENTENRRLSGNSNQTKSSFSLRSSSGTPVPEEDHDYNSIFSRAADLVKASLSLEHGGGVLFLDTVAAPAAYEGNGKFAVPTVQANDQPLSGDALNPSVSRTASNGSQREGVSRNGHCAVLASSYHSASEGDARETHVPDQQNHSSVPARCLMKFVKRFPEGRMWYYPELHSSSDSEPNKSTEPKRSSEELELKKLFSHLPGALQLLFIPFWNMHLSRWAVCLAYTLTRHRVFTYEVDYYFSRAFCNCVKAEIDRLAVVFADKQKGDFIGSVSHELRSPLHGILASCEFLDETETTTFQRSLIDTTESCAHTLLDTIDMVLDYSKINAFAKTKDSTPNPVIAQAQVVKGGTEPLLNIHSTVNIAAIAEEVIEGIATGHLAKSESNMRFNDAGSSSGRGSRRDQGSSNTTETYSANSTRFPVEIIFEIVSPPDWFFVTQPGAFRRLLMNIFGNALKYTEHGFIKISLDRSDADGSPPCSPGSAPDANTSLVTFTVTDSGKGITQSFMQTKMFTAFAQENPMAPGTGLGLSLVRSIVNMLNGDIKIESQVDVGTVVTVTIPMKKAAPSVVPVDEGTRYPALETLKQLHPKPQVAVYEQSLLGETERQSEVSQMQRQALAGYTRGWYDLDSLKDWTVETHADVLCIDEIHLPAVIEILNRLDEPGPSLIVFCANASRISMITRSVTYPKLEVMAKPFGPYKLAKVLRLALSKTHRKGSSAEETTGSISPKPLVGTRAKDAHTRMHQDSRPHSGISNVAQSGQRRSIVTSTPSAKIIGVDEGFPFPSVKFTPSSSSMTPTSPSSPKTEPSGPHHRRMKSLDAPSVESLSEDSNAITRSRSDSELRVERTHRQPTLLLVDDNEVNLKLLHMFVARRCYQSVTLARDGAQAVAAYREAMTSDKPIDFIFMDISMPIMDGFEATRNIRLLESSSAAQRADRTVPAHQALIVAITGNASAKDQEDAFTHGLDFYMTKPASLKETGKLLQQWEEKCKEHGAEGAREAMLTTNTVSSA